MGKEREVVGILFLSVSIVCGERKGNGRHPLRICQLASTNYFAHHCIVGLLDDDGNPLMRHEFRDLGKASMSMLILLQ